EIAVEQAGDRVLARPAWLGVVRRDRHGPRTNRPVLEPAARDRIIPAHADAVGDLEIVFVGRLVHALLVGPTEALARVGTGDLSGRDEIPRLARVLVE